MVVGIAGSQVPSSFSGPHHIQQDFAHSDDYLSTLHMNLAPILWREKEALTKKEMVYGNVCGNNVDIHG